MTPPAVTGGTVLAVLQQIEREEPRPLRDVRPEVPAALAEVDELDMDGYHLYHATRADLLRRLGRRAEAAAAYDRAIALAGNAAERAFLAARRTDLDEHRN